MPPFKTTPADPEVGIFILMLLFFFYIGAPFMLSLLYFFISFIFVLMFAFMDYGHFKYLVESNAT